ncbi:MAG TPA: amino acid permease [Planctomycetota bacterium]|jgi:amino acid transporter|nr:amino acid permease [Planctomycetota bacterium]OQC20808.1 MAG: Serine/threonine exchanger SteT [Planctomycetes bacterium ADurb.Bin069]HNR99368.1 amino acid permease [Planctomycetota bacterium]HNU25587.1 amino acid permease [Planctomycetota bacterium]HOE30038.1 amino acid permease [Planctomycetota bacterium]
MDPRASRDADPPRAAAPAGAAVVPRLGLWDAVSIIVGIVVGTAIFRSAPAVFQNVGGPWQALGVWLLGGVLCLFGAFCYAELATAYPRNGGDYEYLSRAFGSGVGFLFGWAQLACILTGSIGVMAYAFADYALCLGGLSADAVPYLAAGAIVTVSAVNLLGIIVCKYVQNVLTLAKIAGLGGVVLAGVFWGGEGVREGAAGASGVMGPGLGLALVLVLYTYGGWNDASFVAAEVRNQRRNMPRALILGIGGIALIYLLVNAAYLWVLGFEGARATATPAADVLDRAAGSWGAAAISALVMVSALGAINGMILTGARVYSTVGEDHRIFKRLGARHPRTGAPVAAIVAQALVALLLALLVGTARGRGAVDGWLAALGAGTIPWSDYGGGFETLIAGTAPVFWSFFLLTGVAFFVLRFTDRARERPFRVPLFPLPPLVFCGTCLYMLWSSLAYAGWLALLGGVPLGAGAVVYGLRRR